jgi:hypothetical protein
MMAALPAGVAAMVALYGTLPRVGHAQVTTTWISSSDGLFSDPLNWDNGVPTSADDARFASAGGTPLVTFTGNAASSTLVVGSQTATFGLGGFLYQVGGTIDIGSFGAGAGHLTLNTGSLSGNALNVGRGSSGAAMGSGSLTVTGGTVVQVDTFFTIGGATAVVFGTPQNYGTGHVTLGSGSSVTAASFAGTTGSLTLAGASVTAGSISFGSGFSIFGHGTIAGRVPGSSTPTRIRAENGTLTIGDAAETDGFRPVAQNIDVFSGTLELQSAQAARLATGTTLLNDGIVRGTSGLTLSANPNITGTGNLRSHGTSAVDSGLTLTTGTTVETITGTLSLGTTAAAGLSLVEGTLRVASGTTITLLSSASTDLGNVVLTSGTLEAAQGATLVAGKSISGSGAVHGPLLASESATITATGDLELGTSAGPGGFVGMGTLTAGPHRVTLLDASPATLGATSLTTLAGGTLAASNGILLDGGTISGYGTIDASIQGSSTISATGPLHIGNATATINYGGLLEVGAHQVNLQSAAPAALGNVTMTGGTLRSDSGLKLDIGDSISGYGIIFGDITGSAGLTALNPTGVVSMPDQLEVGSDAMTILTQGQVQLGTLTTLAGGTLGATGRLRVGPGAVLWGHGQILTPLSSENGSRIVVTGGDLSLGNSGTFAAFSIAGQIEVATGRTLTLQTLGLASLGELTTLDDATLSAANGIALGAGANLQGHGIVAGRVLAGIGSTIVVAGTLSLGDAASVSGFFSDGELYVGAHTVTLNDANEVVLGSLTTLGSGGSPGTLVAENGAVLQFGRNITGFGTVNTANDPFKPLINNGSIIGNSTADPITLPGYVKGVGTMDNVVITGTDAPGFSPATVYRGSVSYQGRLEIEIGGTTPGSQHDLIVHSGHATLGGTLAVSLINGYLALPGQQFQVMTFDSSSGQFGNIVGDTGHAGLWFEAEYDAESLSVRASALGGDANLDGQVTIADLGVLAANWQQEDRYWFHGDFNYDGTVNIADLGILAANWQTGAGSSMNFQDAVAIFDVFDGVVIPEPGLAGLLLGFGMLGLRRRR